MKSGILLIALATLLFIACPAAADRPGWNEPPRTPGHDRNGLLKINGDFFDMAAATGGDFYFWAPGEFAASAGLLDVPIASDPIALSYRSGGDNFAQSLEVPVDSAITRLTLFAGAQRLDELRMLRPDGRTVEENPADIAVQVYEHMRIVTVEDPEPGLWRIEARAAGSCSIAARYLSGGEKLRVRGLEPVDLVDFAFVEVRGRPGHEGLFPVEMVRAGEERLCRIALSRGVREPAVELVSAAGEVIGPIRLDASAGESAPDEFIGLCRVPEQPFRVRVRGLDQEGHLVQRITTALIMPE